MRTRFLSRNLSGRRILTAVACVVVMAVLVPWLWGYIERSWYAPRCSAAIIATLDERTQSLDQQLAIINRAIGTHIGNYNAHYLRARKLTEMKKYKQAAHAWAVLEGKLPRALNDLYRSDLGMCLLFSGRPVEAISCFQESILRSPDHVSSRVELAAAYAELGMHHKVRDELTMLARLKPDWREWFLSVPEWPDERNAIVEKLKPFLDAVPGASRE